MEIFHIIAAHILLFLSIMGLGGSALVLISNAMASTKVDVSWRFAIGSAAFALYYLNY